MRVIRLGLSVNDTFKTSFPPKSIFDTFSEIQR